MPAQFYVTVSAMEARILCSVPILTLNVRPHLERLLPVLRTVCDDVFIVDGNSTDGTVEYAQSLGVRVERQSADAALNRRITDFTEARLHSWGLARHDWIFIIDADEVPTPELLATVQQIVGANNPKVAARFRRLAQLPNGEVVKHAVCYPEQTMIRLFHRGAGITLTPNRKVHERFVVPPSVQVAKHSEAFVHAWPTPPIFRQKLAHYASMEYDGWQGKGIYDRLRWVVWYNLTSVVGQCVRAVRAFIVGHVRREAVLPWAYTWPLIAYRFRAMAQGLRRP